MGGGYSVNLKDIINAHSNTFELAQDIFFNKNNAEYFGEISENLDATKKAPTFK